MRYEIIIFILRDKLFTPEKTQVPQTPDELHEMTHKKRIDREVNNLQVIQTACTSVIPQKRVHEGVLLALSACQYSLEKKTYMKVCVCGVRSQFLLYERDKCLYMYNI
jgi:hypothetical protein